MSALFDSDFNLGGIFSLGSTRSVYRSRSNSAHSFHSARSQRHRSTHLQTPRELVPTINTDTDSECESGKDEHTIYPPSSVISKDIDRGWAWAVLVAAFLCNVINIGVNNSVGVYNAEFLRQFPDEKRSYVSLAGSLQNSVCGLTGLVSGIISNKYSCRTSILLGSIISSLGFIGTAFSNTVPEIIATFGIVVGFGTGLVYTATSVCVGQYFHQRRPMALGIATAGMAVGQFICPPLFQFLIEVYTWRGSAFMVAGMCLNNCIFGTVMKPLPVSELNGDKDDEEEYVTKDAHIAIHVDDMDDDHSVKFTKGEIGNPMKQFAEQNGFKEGRGEENGTRKECRVNGTKKSTLDIHSFLSVSIGALGSVTSNISQNFVSNNELGTAEETARPSCTAYFKSLIDVRPLKSPEFVCFGIAVLFWGAQVLTCGLHLIAYTLENGTTPQEGAILLSVFGACNFFSRLLAGAATNDKDHVDQVTLGAGVLGISGLLLFLTPLFIQHYWSQVVFAALYGVYSTILIPLMAPLTVETVGLSSLGAGFGYLMVMSGTGCAIGPPLAGLIYDVTEDYSYSFYFAGALAVGGCIMLLAIPIFESRHHKRAENKVTST